MPLPTRCSSLAAVLLAGVVALQLAEPAFAQPSGVPVIRDSSVGYIDPAIPGDVLRFRYDDTFGNPAPSRAEFFWPRSGAAGPGPALPEKSVDYQDFSAYGELAWNNRLSFFLNAPARILNPEVNANHSGFGDIDAGFKFALIYTPEFVVTSQLRTYAPTGHAREGLGNHHVTVEPGLLMYRALTQRIGLEAEVKNWIPIGGTDFSGNIFRYGIGVNYWIPLRGTWQLTPVAEFVGWTIMGGKSSTFVEPDTFVVEDAQGTTIVNAKLGARLRMSERIDMYAGYGRPLTGDIWYEDTIRAELRWSY